MTSTYTTPEECMMRHTRFVCHRINQTAVRWCLLDVISNAPVASGTAPNKTQAWQAARDQRAQMESTNPGQPRPGSGSHRTISCGKSGMP